MGGRVSEAVSGGDVLVRWDWPCEREPLFRLVLRGSARLIAQFGGIRCGRLQAPSRSFLSAIRMA